MLETRDKFSIEVIITSKLILEAKRFHCNRNPVALFLRDLGYDVLAYMNGVEISNPETNRNYHAKYPRAGVEFMENFTVRHGYLAKPKRFWLKFQEIKYRDLIRWYER